MGRTKREIWQSNVNKAITQSKLLLKTKKLGKIIKLIEDMQELINYGEARVSDEVYKLKLRELKPAQDKLYTLGTNLGADLAKFGSKPLPKKGYVDHPVYGKLRY